MWSKFIIFVFVLTFLYESCVANYNSQCNEVNECANVSTLSHNKKKMLQALKECLLDDYTENESMLSPPPIPNGTFLIRYKYSVNDLISVDKDVAEIEVLMNLFWKDDCLRWNEADINFPYVMMNPKDIWRPTFFVSPTVSPISSQEDSQIIVHSNGECEESLIFRIKITCENFPLYFPNDYQNCSVNFKFKMITNFTLSPFNDSTENICVKSELELGEWFIECDEYVNREEVIPNTGHWPYLGNTTANNLFIGNINGTFKIKRSPHYTYSSIMLPLLVVCVCSQIISVIPPSAQSYANILSSLFLSLTVLLSNLPSFSKFALLSLLINWIYCLCASNVIIAIVGNTLSAQKQACLVLFQRFYPKICCFVQFPISFFLILSLSITMPMLGALLLQRFYGFITGIILMLIVWTVIAVYKIFARISAVRMKSENEEQSAAPKNPPSKSKKDDDKYQIAKLTQAVDELTSAIQQFSEAQQLRFPKEESPLRVRSIAGNRSNGGNSSSKLGDEQTGDIQMETQIDGGAAKAKDKTYESLPIKEGKDDVEVIRSKEIIIDPEFISKWNAQLALCICRIWTCIQILTNLFLNITLWIIYYRFWEPSL